MSVFNFVVALVIFALAGALLFCAIALKNAKTQIHANYDFSFFAERVLDNLEPALFLFDSQGLLYYCNEAAMLLLEKCSKFSKKGVSFHELEIPSLLPIFDKLSFAIKNLESFVREYRVYLKGGVRCYLCTVSQVDFTDTGVFSLVLLTDKTAEDEAKQKLSIQLEETKRYISSKDNFFANMSHEIRTPINAILGMTYFAKLYADSEKSKEYISKIESASEILLGVVNDILDFSKMQEHKFSLKKEVFNCYELKKVIIDLFSLKAIEKNLDFQVSFDCPSPFYVFGDQFRLTQIFINLVSNALKFTDSGFVSVVLNTERLGSDVILRCSVHDSGKGLTEENISMLFTEYEQFGQVLLKNHEGTGLGLAICKRLVELMNGVIWVDSTPEKGSVFHFVVVLELAEDVGAQKSISLPKLQKKSGIVLVVEDNEINREITESLVLSAGFVVEHAKDGLEAVDICSVKAVDYYDLILMDIHMPHLNGYDTARILKTEKGIKSPIFVISATSGDDSEYQHYKEYLDGSLTKPFDQKVFLKLFGE